MKAEYNFSGGERGKFHSSQADFSFPVYLAPDVNAMIERLAEENGVDVNTLVDEWLRANLRLVESVRRAS